MKHLPICILYILPVISRNLFLLPCLTLLQPVCPFSGTALARLRSYCACKVPFRTLRPPAFAAASLCHSSRACSSKSPSTPDSANLMIISNIVNYPVLGGINLPPPHMEQIGILFIVSDFVNSPVRGDLHEGQNHQPSGMRSAMCSKGVIYVVHLCDSASVV